MTSRSRHRAAVVRKIGWGVVCLDLVVLCTALYVYAIVKMFGPISEPATLGQSFGLAAATISSLALLGVVLSLFLQGREYARATKDALAQRIEVQQQLDVSRRRLALLERQRIEALRAQAAQRHLNYRDTVTYGDRSGIDAIGRILIDVEDALADGGDVAVARSRVYQVLNHQRDSVLQYYLHIRDISSDESVSELISSLMHTKEKVLISYCAFALEESPGVSSVLRGRGLSADPPSTH